jgi:hypothetical protein|tara:strand:- start:596 stop:1138 length:543 start_codon:yes stop_codon:yes gene_type:complete
MEYFTNDFETDCHIMYMYLEDLPIFRTTNRAKHNNGVRPISNVYGTTNFSKIANKYDKVIYRKKNPCGDGYLTKLKQNHPEYEFIFQEFIFLHGKSFKFNQIVINYNFKITKHLDAKNVGTSMIIGLGDYKGGELNIENEKGKIKTVNIKNKFYKFNGSKLYHWVNEFKGDRYSLVFYNI